MHASACPPGAAVGGLEEGRIGGHHVVSLGKGETDGVISAIEGVVQAGLVTGQVDEVLARSFEGCEAFPKVYDVALCRGGAGGTEHRQRWKSTCSGLGRSMGGGGMCCAVADQISDGGAALGGPCLADKANNGVDVARDLRQPALAMSLHESLLCARGGGGGGGGVGGERGRGKERGAQMGRSYFCWRSFSRPSVAVLSET